MYQNHHRQQERGYHHQPHYKSNYHHNPHRQERPNIDREKTCPFLIRIFYSEKEKIPIEEFKKKGFEQQSNEIQIHTWKDADLREIIELVKTALPQDLVQKDSIFDIGSVFIDPLGNWRRKDLGSVHSYKKGPEDQKTLQEFNFQIADYIDVIIKNK